jgi:uncharacterized membrane protein YkoI
MERLTLPLALVCAALALGAPLAASAQGYPDSRPSYGAGQGDEARARAAVKRGSQAPLSKVIANIAAQTKGRQLNTTMGDYGGRPAYFVQWQTPDNRVMVFICDAESGQVIGRQ